MNSDFYNGKKVLVTGHTGFKGSWLCHWLLLKGAEVTGYALKPEDNSLFEQLNLKNRMNSVIGDVRDYETLTKVFSEAQPEIVFHLAAQPIVLTSYKEPRYTFETNVMGTVNLLECIRNNTCVRSFLNVTTDKVYENDDLDKAFSEDDKLDGFDPYSNSKSCSELVTHSYDKSFLKDVGVRVSTARAGNVIGGGDDAENRIIPDCVRASVKGEPIIIRNPYAVRPFQHVMEPLAVYMMIAEKQYHDENYCGSYNVGPDICDCVTTGKLADIFCKYYEGASWQTTYTDGPHEAAFLKLDCNKLKNVFLWQPKTHIDEAVKLTVDYYKSIENGESASSVLTRQICDFEGR